MNVSFTREELEQVKSALDSYVNIMSEAEQTVELVSNELENCLSSAIDKIDSASTKEELGIKH